MQPRHISGIFGIALLASGACVGSIGDGARQTPGEGPAGSSPDLPRGQSPGGLPPSPGSPGVPGAAPAAPGGPAVAGGAGRMRRLTSVQLRNTLQDLLGPIALGELEPDDDRDGFASVGASYSAFSPRGAELYENALLAGLGALFSDAGRRAALFTGSCTPSAADDLACLRRFVGGFGKRAWRRPLSDAEVNRWAALAADINKSYGDATTGLMHALSGLLASPNFLYRIELGQPEAGGASFRFTGWEMASRLSYFFWNSTPDAALMAAAESGALDRADGIRAQADRLLASDLAKVGLGTFVSEVFELRKLAESPKPDARYTEGLRTAMAAEVTRLFEGSLRPGVDVLGLLDTKQTFVNEELARLYGIKGVTGTDLSGATLPAEIPRAGLLGTAAFLTITSPQSETSPTARGVFLNERVLCREVPPPPDNVDTNLPPPPAGQVLTKREQLDGHRSNPVCASCHALFDPMGYAFENFDWIGGYRGKEPNGKTIDASGELEGQRFANAVDLAVILRGMPDVERCLVTNLHRVASGHHETAADAPTIADWHRRFDGTGRQLLGLLAEIVTTDGFRYASAAP